MWSATLSNNEKFEESSEVLQGHGMSPWRALEKYAQESSCSIVSASFVVGSNEVIVDSDGYKLTVGKVVEQTLSTGSGAQTSVLYWFIRREENDRWVWVVTDGCDWWEVVGLVGDESRPPMDAMICL